MILNLSKYKRFKNILFIIGFTTLYSYAQDFSYEKSNNSLSYNKFYFDTCSVSVKNGNKAETSEITDNEYTTIINKLAPAAIDYISKEEIVDDENIKLLSFNVYLKESNLNDQDYIDASIEASNAFKNKNIIVTYL